MSEKIILFQGDSITDADRRRDPEGLGYGYVRMAAKTLEALYPDKAFRVLNRGIGGNRVPDLEARWQEDCIDLKPDLLFVFIGINDSWRNFDKNLFLPHEEFEAGYRRILTRVKEETAAEIVLIEPFVIPVRPGQDTWWTDLGGKQTALRKLAREFDCPLIPLDGIFASLTAQEPPELFAADGVHPTPEGARVIAREVLEYAEDFVERLC